MRKLCVSQEKRRCDLLEEKRKSNGKTPQQFLQEMPGQFVSETIASLQDLTRLPKPTTNGEIKERIDTYFNFCQERGMIPEIEGLAAALRTSRKTLYMWSRGSGCDSERMEIIENAKNLIHSFLMQASLRGKVPIPTGIFLMKNWLGYRDTVSIENSYPEKVEERKIMSMDELPRLTLDEDSEWSEKTEEPEKMNCDE